MVDITKYVRSINVFQRSGQLPRVDVTLVGPMSLKVSDEAVVVIEKYQAPGVESSQRLGDPASIDEV
ncbi:MAG: hypothetical protein JW395_1069 [Nitrospira sp.]|nr:hypothetical protein [Nitrospira sp.]